MIRNLKESAKTLDAFFGQFGEPDIYVRVVLEEFFKELYGQTHKQAVLIPGKTRQDGNKSPSDIQGPINTADQSNGRKAPGPVTRCDFPIEFDDH